ncbi:helix-turn-helix domain-containing protein [Agrilactobacillus fermenti]|uniref:helix-turn-helix domain-containing protein n=1 Tax=Agrilactobacillus fermenti TaxID=2586909 RepID=UPI001E3F9862|nr:helix-turn-helix domain-containing protein [Agrilactobacillus fermenti]
MYQNYNNNQLSLSIPLEINIPSNQNDMDYTGATKKYDDSYERVFSSVDKFKQGGREALVDRRGKAKSDDGHLSGALRKPFMRPIL